MTSFYERLYSRESQELFEPMVPAITEISSLVAGEIKRLFSDDRYAGSRKLKLLWSSSNKFEASAGVDPSNEDHHSIHISYGAVIAMYKDAFLLPQMCTRHLIEEKYTELFNLLDYGQGRDHVLPSDLSPESAKLSLFELSVAWLYLHEQGHLFQSHGAVYSRIEKDDSLNFSCAWNSSDPENNEKHSLSGRKAWIKHAFELSADYEATNLIIQYLMYKNQGIVKLTSIWLLISALTCIFHKFHGSSRPYHSGAALGTHPDPALRMRSMYIGIIQTLEHPNLLPHLQANKTIEDYKRVMEHAYNSANIYIKIAHFDDNTFPEFMTRFIDKSDSDKEYFKGIKDIWKELRPKVLETYFGYGEGSIMPDFS